MGCTHPPRAARDNNCLATSHDVLYRSRMALICCMNSVRTRRS